MRGLHFTTCRKSRVPCETQMWLERDVKGEEKERELGGSLHFPDPSWQSLPAPWLLGSECPHLQKDCHPPAPTCWASPPPLSLQGSSRAVVKLQAAWVQIPAQPPLSHMALGHLAHLPYLSFSISKMGMRKTPASLGLLGGLKDEVLKAVRTALLLLLP